MADKENIGTRLLDDLGSMLLNIEIDSDLWVGKDRKAKLRYLKNKLSGENRKKLINVGTHLVESVIDIVKSNASGPMKDYADVAETALNLGKASMIINNLFVSQKYEVHTDYDELAKFMGYKNGQAIHTTQMDSTGDICRALVEMKPEIQDKYGIKITKTHRPPTTGSGTGGEMVTVYLLAKYKKVNVGIEVNYYNQKNKDSNVNQDAGYSYINLGVYNADMFGLSDSDDEDNVDILDDVVHIIYANYISSIDIKKNLIKIDGGHFHTEPRRKINFDIHNIDLADMSKTCRAVLSSKRRRGYILQGDPGTGKTVSIHKLVMDFTDVPVFWISSDSLNDTGKIRSVFRILNMFPGSIFVFDDIDGNDFSKKDNLTTTFITCIDETNSNKFSGVIIMTINDPQRINSTIKTRNGRIDEVIHVKNPETFDQVFDVITQRYKCLDAFMPNWMDGRSEEFQKLVQTIISANFTHAHIAGIISDLVDLYPDGYSIEDFASSVNKRIQSIANAAMVTGSDGHIVEAKK
jgi:hypothetical protein